jgi:hypothetical protein
MNRHPFSPLTFGSPNGPIKSDWCGYLAKAFEELKTDEQWTEATCHKPVGDPIHDPAMLNTSEVAR